MILQALTGLYEDLISRGDIARPGWSMAKISYALCLEEDGSLLQVIPLLVPEQVRKKTLLRPRKMELPAAVTRSSGVLPNFLWDNSSYLLGADGKGKPERSLECFRACAKLHHDLLDGVDSAAAKAILKAYYLKNPNPQCPEEVLHVSLNENSTNIPIPLAACLRYMRRCRSGPIRESTPPSRISTSIPPPPPPPPSSRFSTISARSICGSWTPVCVFTMASELSC